MSAKKLLIIKSELSALRNRYDQILGELDELIKSMSPTVGDQPRKRQNKKSERVLSVDAWYERRKRKTA